MAKIISMDEAVELFKDDDILLACCFGMGGWPHELMSNVQDKFFRTGHPCNLTHVHAAGCIGESLMGVEGFVTRNISSHQSTSPHLAMVTAQNKNASWYMPLGAMLQMYREQGRGLPGALSKVGLGTFMDPRVEGGCLNDKARELTKQYAEQGCSLIEYVPDFFGEEYLFYRGLKYTKAILRGTSADTNGNISCEKESYNLELATAARAVKACGGKVIVQVERIVPAGQLNPKLVKVGRNLVDYVVVATRPEMIVQGLHGAIPEGSNYGYWDGLTGQQRVVLGETLPPLELDPKKVICRRATMEIEPDTLCNFGIGMPTFLGNVLNEEGCMDDITMISESGSVGGVPGGGPDFGCHWNLEWATDQGDHFDWFDGTGLDFGAFGLSEAQEDGSMNVSFLNGVTLGVGGFSNITRGSKKAIFIGTFTTKGLKEHIENGKLVIDQEGKIKKFVKKCDQISFDANVAVKQGKPVKYITERCVIERTEEGMVLTEVAPGVDIQKDIIDQMEFEPVIPAGGPKLMPAEIFAEEWGGLRAIFDAKAAEKADK